jgi:HK97 family phage major capsid protein
MAAAAESTAHETLVFESDEALKAMGDVQDNKVRVGAYAIRFSTAAEKDLQGDYFTAETKFGRDGGNGAPVLFHHGMTAGKGGLLGEMGDGEYGPAKATRDDTGIFAEVMLDLSDKHQAAFYAACQKGALRWSSGSAQHMVRKADDGRILRWPIVEFSLTPKPVEPRLPALRPLKSLDLTAGDTTAITAALAVDTGEPPTAKAQPISEPAPVITMADKTPAELAAEKAEQDRKQQEAINSAVKARELAIEEIGSIGEQFRCQEDARKAIRDGVTPDDFRKHVLTNVLKAAPVDLTAGLCLNGDQDAISKFSVLKACYQLATKGRLEGREKACHEAAVKAIGRDAEVGTRAHAQGFIIPEDVLRFDATKAQNIGVGTAGGFTMQPTLGPMIELLRNKMRVSEAGATSLGGLTGDVFLPQHVSGATAYWVSETGALTDSQSVFAQKKLTPHRVGSTIPYTTQFLQQSSIDAESFIRNDATTVIAIAKDLAALLGTGVAGQPLGLANTSGINATVTYSGAATWADVVEHETGIAVDNADIGNMAFILSAASVGKWKTILRDSVAGAKYLIDDGMIANGYRVLRTNQIASANQSFFGVWAQFILASWAGLEVIVDPYALKMSGHI